MDSKIEASTLQRLPKIRRVIFFSSPFHRTLNIRLKRREFNESFSPDVQSSINWREKNRTVGFQESLKNGGFDLQTHRGFSREEKFFNVSTRYDNARHFREENYFRLPIAT